MDRLAPARGPGLRRAPAAGDAAPSLLRHLRQALVVSLTNPKVLLFYFALLPLFLRAPVTAESLATMVRVRQRRQPRLPEHAGARRRRRGAAPGAPAGRAPGGAASGGAAPRRLRREADVDLTSATAPAHRRLSASDPTGRASAHRPRPAPASRRARSAAAPPRHRAPPATRRWASRHGAWRVGGRLGAAADERLPGSGRARSAAARARPSQRLQQREHLDDVEHVEATAARQRLRRQRLGFGEAAAGRSGH